MSSKNTKAKSHHGRVGTLDEVSHCGGPSSEQIAQARKRIAAEHPEWRPARVQQRAWIEAQLQPAICAVAYVVEQLEDNEARIRWLFNPVPAGQELLWDHGS